MLKKIIFFFQVCSLAGIWCFSLGISIWIIYLIWLANKLHDAETASLGISLVAIPTFLMGAGILTYVFVGLQRGKEE